MAKLKIFKRIYGKRKLLLPLLIGFSLGLVAVYLAHAKMESTSTDEYCESCHIHPQATKAWKQGSHYRTASGVVTHCVDCHLPPKGFDYVWEKGKAGARDFYGYLFKDPEDFDWEEISILENAVHYTFDASCSKCHLELFPLEMTKKGVDAHIHYQKNLDEIRCINCHLKTGHFHEDATETEFVVAEEETVEREWAPLVTEIAPGALIDYTETIPGSSARFEMVAVEGGTFRMGASESDPFSEPDELPQKEVQLSSFWMGKFEVSWTEFEAYYAATATRGKNEQGLQVDAITGPTPPYGSPDQGWGRGYRPAITMTFYAATKYCEWLSEVTGRTYRLPTEAEWEYAVRGGTEGPFFFDSGEPASWFQKITQGLFGGAVDEALLGEYAWFSANSKRRTHPPETKKPNPLGLENMLGNVKEFCLDWYSPDAYASDGPMVDPKGPPTGEEHVVRGGSYGSGPEELRSSARDQTRHEAWMKTDPQLPKSVWWYSDNKEVGFRVVREFSEDKDPSGQR